MLVDKEWRGYLKKKMMDMKVELNCIMGVTKIKGQELLKLKIDDVILLDQKPGDLAIVNIEGIPKFKGFPGSCNKSKAVRISEIIKEE
jgi:flagellar motor switch protein FliM